MAPSLSPISTAAEDSLFHGWNPFFPIAFSTFFSNQCHRDIWRGIFKLHITITAIVPCQQLWSGAKRAWVFIFGFVSLFLGLGLCLCLGLCVKCQGNIWQDPRAPPPPSATPTSVVINLYPFFFFSLSLSLLVWFFVCLGFGQFTDWVFLCDIRIWWFLIWVWNGVWVWSFADLWVLFDLGFVSKWF